MAVTTVKDYRITFVDESPSHMVMFLPFSVILDPNTADKLTVNAHFEIERLTDEKRYWKCEYIVKTVITDNSRNDIVLKVERGRDTTIMLRPPIEVGKLVEYGYCDADIEMDVQNKMFTKGMNRYDAVIEVLNEA